MLKEKAKSLLKSAFPRGAKVYRRLRVARKTFRDRALTSGDIFSSIYRENFWGERETVSGRGSTLARTSVVRRELPALLSELRAESLLDAPCGDFNWMREVDLRGVVYTGADVVAELVERNRRLYGGEGRRFITADLTRDALPRADVILCRECLVHLSFRHVRAALKNFRRSGSQYLLVTTHTKVLENEEVATGDWRPLNLELPPLNFPPPLRLLVEDAELGKCLGLWRLGALPYE